MKVKVVKIKRAQFEPIRFDVKCDERTAKDKDGNVLFVWYSRDKYTVHANGSDIKFDWFLNRAFGVWEKVTWD